MHNSFFIKSAGLISAGGNDFFDYINRMSTNDFRKFGVNEFRKTVLTSDKGRIIDLITIVNINKNNFILSSPINTGKVISHLEKYIIMDDVTIKLSDDKINSLKIFPGNYSETSVLIAGKEISGCEAVSLNETDFVFQDNFRDKSLNVICCEENLSGYTSKLKDFTEMSFTDYENFRIDNGIPESDNELNEDINPLECGLKEYISFNKGCYIGQEVIARLDSQNKIPKQMVKIVSDSEISEKDKIFSDEKEAGFISSAVYFDEKYKGLGFIRSTELDYGKSFLAEHNNEKFKINILKIN